MDDATDTALATDAEEEFGVRIEYMPGVFLTPRTTIPKYEKVGMGIAYWSNWLSIAPMMVLLVMTFVDVLLRTVFSNPLSGVFDWTRYIMVLVATFGMPLCAMNDEHVSIDLLTRLMPNVIQNILAWMNYILVLGYMYFLITENIRQAIFNKTIGQTSTGVPWPTYPFYYFIAFGFACMLLIVIVKMIDLARGVK
jgi:TRAP-type C4-dicarboxylate transport system permease small subunit